MAVIIDKAALLLLVGSTAQLLSGCGLTQKMTEGTAAMTQALFYQQVNQLHLDIYTREALNINSRGEALSTVIRIYQLKDRHAFDKTDYLTLLSDDSLPLKTDILGQKDIYLPPGGAVAVDIPLDKEARYVAVAGMFIAPDIIDNTWRVVLSRGELDPDKARAIEANGHSLLLKPV